MMAPPGPDGNKLLTVTGFNLALLSVTGSSKDYFFTGKEKDASGLYYFGARYYDPEVGRFISEDPGQDGDNWYGYCDGNPVNRVDPDGMAYGYYIIQFKSGKYYIGKGDQNRMNASAIRVSKANKNDLVVSKTHFSAINDYESFLGEATLIEKYDGINGGKLYNKINSPGKKYLNAGNKLGHLSIAINSLDVFCRSYLLDKMNGDIRKIRQGKYGENLRDKLRYVDWQVGTAYDLNKNPIFGMEYILGYYDFYYGSELVEYLYDQLQKQPIRM